MTYLAETGSWQSDFLEKILDTGIRCDVPYKIDRKKYEDVVKKYSLELRIKDADVVIFHVDYSKDFDDMDGKFTGKTFFAWPKNSPEGSDDFYDCFQFHDWDDGHHIDVFENFVHELLESVMHPDPEYLGKLKDTFIEKRKQTNKDIRIISKLLKK